MAALALKWIGLYVIHEKLSKLTYELKDQISGQVSGLVHKTRLRTERGMSKPRRTKKTKGFLPSTAGFGRSKEGSRKRGKRRFVDLTFGHYNLRPRKPSSKGGSCQASLLLEPARLRGSHGGVRAVWH